MSRKGGKKAAEKMRPRQHAHLERKKTTSNYIRSHTAHSFFQESVNTMTPKLEHLEAGE